MRITGAQPLNKRNKVNRWTSAINKNNCEKYHKTILFPLTAWHKSNVRIITFRINFISLTEKSVQLMCCSSMTIWINLSRKLPQKPNGIVPKILSNFFRVIIVHDLLMDWCSIYHKYIRYVFGHFEPNFNSINLSFSCVKLLRNLSEFYACIVLRTRHVNKIKIQCICTAIHNKVVDCC